MPPIQIFLMPVLLLLALSTATGLGLWLSALNVRYRDVHHAIPFVILVGLTTSLLGYDSLLLKAWDGLTTWPGPFSIFNARWMLIDV